MKEITIDFGNITNELESKELKLCIRKHNGVIFLLNNKNELYLIDKYYIGYYIDSLIKNKLIAKFTKIDDELRNMIGDWELEEINDKRFSIFII